MIAARSPRRSWVSWVWLHFAGIGALLFVVHDLLWSAGTGNARVAADFDWAQASERELLYREALRRGLDRDDSVVRRRLVQNMRFLASVDARAGEGDDEDLYREALALGLDRSDAVVRRRLVEKMRHMLISQRAVPSPDEAALREHLRLHPERFEHAASVRIEQLYYTTHARAREARSKLGQSGAAAEIAIDGDPLPIPRRLPRLAQRELAARFGESFASEALALPVGGWSRPIASSYGAHLIWVHERLPSRTSTLAEVRGALRADWVADREEQVLAVALGELRGQQVSGSSRPSAKSRELAQAREFP